MKMGLAVLRSIQADSQTADVLHVDAKFRNKIQHFLGVASITF